jgi:hypothetical protein
MEAIIAILRMMIVEYLDAEMNCGWCVFFVDRQQKKCALTILASKFESFDATHPD